MDKFGIQDSYKFGIQDLDKFGIQEALKTQVIWHKRMLQAIVYEEIDCKASLNILTGDLIGTFCSFMII